MQQYKTGSGNKIEFKEIVKIIKEKLKDEEYYLVIGSDSQKHKKRRHVFVTVIALVNKGHGGIFFFKKRRVENIKYSLIEKLYAEAYETIQLGEELLKNKIPVDKIEVHLDLSEDGKSKKFVNGIVGMCTAYGFETKIKNESWASNGIADKYSKYYK